MIYIRDIPSKRGRVIKKVKGGFAVFGKSGRRLSKKAKTKAAALKQLRAVEASKARRGKR